jgi:hypothetical protein
MAGFRSIKKTVILKIPTIILTTITDTDTNFLTKMQKRGNPLNENCPPATINLQNLIVLAR